MWSECGAGGGMHLFARRHVVIVELSTRHRNRLPGWTGRGEVRLHTFDGTRHGAALPVGRPVEVTHPAAVRPHLAEGPVAGRTGRSRRARHGASPSPRRRRGRCGRPPSCNKRTAVAVVGSVIDFSRRSEKGEVPPGSSRRA